MPAPLVAIAIQSIYGNPHPGPMPRRMARVSPDFRGALLRIATDVASVGGYFAVSDLYRTYTMQVQAHNDYVSGKKRAYSPSPGGSMHEAGRAVDIDVGHLRISLPAFWDIAARHGVVPILSEPNPRASECWHFECRGSHQRVYDYYRQNGWSRPARGMATSAILALGQRHDEVRDLTIGRIQGALIRLGFEPGPVDGVVGKSTTAAAANAGVSLEHPAAALGALESRLASAFPAEHTLAADDEVVGLAAPRGAEAMFHGSHEEEAARDEDVWWQDQTPIDRARRGE